MKYGKLPQVNNALYVLKPAVLGIIAAGIIKLGRASIGNVFLGVILVGSFIGMRFAGINFLLILIIAGVLNLLIKEGWPRLRKTAPSTRGHDRGSGVITSVNRLAPISDFLAISQDRFFEFRRRLRSLVFAQQGAVAQHQWLTDGQLLDAVALSVATPGPFMLFSTFAGYLAGGVTGAILATFFVFLPSFIFVLAGAHYVEKVRDNKTIQAFLAGVSAAVVGVIAVVSLELIPQALVGWPAILISMCSFLLIVWLKRDVALVAVGAMVGGILYALIRAFV